MLKAPPVRFCAWVLLLCACLSAGRAQTPAGLEYFEAVPLGASYARKDLQAHFGQVDWWELGPQCEAVVVSDPVRAGGHRLRLGFPANLWGENDFRTNVRIPGRKACRLEYRIRFESGWEFSKGNSEQPGDPNFGGGKLPGLAAGSHPSGGKNDGKGMSARMMWRRDKRFGGKLHSYLELYLYWPEQGDMYGDRYYVCEAETGNDYLIQLDVDLGGTGRDGHVRVAINGEERHRATHRFIPAGQDWVVDQAMLHFFYGGHEEPWAPKKRTYLLFDDLKISGLEPGT